MHFSPVYIDGNIVVGDHIAKLFRDVLHLQERQDLTSITGLEPKGKQRAPWISQVVGAKKKILPKPSLSQSRSA
jgi:hypothetical protein